MDDLIPCGNFPPPVTSTVTWISGDYRQSCYIAAPYKTIGGVKCAYIGHLFDDGEVNRKKGISIVFVSQLFVSKEEIQFMSGGENLH